MALRLQKLERSDINIHLETHTPGIKARLSLVSEREAPARQSRPLHDENGTSALRFLFPK